MSRALILDCDGVLADTERDGHLVAFNQTFEELGFPFRWSEEEYADLLKIGGGK
jgi:beta-phosphoglucomutase-like phosphatase (HAD superfamily)